MTFLDQHPPQDELLDDANPPPPLDVPGDQVSALDAPFRCEKFACTMAQRVCLARQVESWTKATRIYRGDRAGVRVEVVKPKHPHCASGTCEQGNAIRAQFPDATHQQHDPRTAPRLDIIRAVEERTMAKTVCPECKSPSKHKSGCSKPPRVSEARAAEKAAPKPRREVVRGATVAGPETMTVAELLELRAGIDRELAARREAAHASLRELDAALAAPSPVRSVG